GLPDHRVATNESKGGVPRPDCNGKIESGDDAHRPEGMPLLHHPVMRTFAGDGEAIELAGEPDREVADVDHLLDLAVTLGQDFPGFDGDEAAELGFGCAQLPAENPDELATSGCRDRPPREERLLRQPDCFGDAIRVRVLDL